MNLVIWEPIFFETELFENIILVQNLTLKNTPILLSILRVACDFVKISRTHRLPQKGFMTS